MIDMFPFPNSSRKLKLQCSWGGRRSVDMDLTCYTIPCFQILYRAKIAVQAFLGINCPRRITLNNASYLNLLTTQKFATRTTRVDWGF